MWSRAASSILRIGLPKGILFFRVSRLFFFPIGVEIFCYTVNAPTNQHHFELRGSHVTHLKISFVSDLQLQQLAD